MRRTMTALGDLGVRVFVTELDAPVAVDLPDRLAEQADRTERAVQTCLLVPACDTVVWWGLRDLAGRVLRLADSPVAPARRRLELVSRDPGSTTGGGDPRRLGGTLRLHNPSSGEQVVLDLAPERWRALPPTAGEAGYAYRGAAGDPCQGVVIRPGRGLEANCRGSGVALTLDEPMQGRLVAELRLGGAPLQCFTFGGTIVRDVGNEGRRGGAFLARNAAPAPTCGAATAP